jgi:hypothetical protein
MVEALAFGIVVGLMLVPILNVLVGAVAGAVLSGPLGAVFGLLTGYGLSVVIAKDRMRARRRRNDGRDCGRLPGRRRRRAASVGAERRSADPGGRPPPIKRIAVSGSRTHRRR